MGVLALRYCLLLRNRALGSTIIHVATVKYDDVVDSTRIERKLKPLWDWIKVWSSTNSPNIWQKIDRATKKKLKFDIQGNLGCLEASLLCNKWIYFRQIFWVLTFLPRFNHYFKTSFVKSAMTSLCDGLPNLTIYHFHPPYSVSLPHYATLLIFYISEGPKVASNWHYNSLLFSFLATQDLLVARARKYHFPTDQKKLGYLKIYPVYQFRSFKIKWGGQDTRLFEKKKRGGSTSSLWVFIH